MLRFFQSIITIKINIFYKNEWEAVQTGIKTTVAVSSHRSEINFDMSWFFHGRHNEWYHNYCKVFVILFDPVFITDYQKPKRQDSWDHTYHVLTLALTLIFPWPLPQPWSWTKSNVHGNKTLWQFQQWSNSAALQNITVLEQMVQSWEWKPMDRRANWISIVYDCTW